MGGIDEGLWSDEIDGRFHVIVWGGLPDSGWLVVKDSLHPMVGGAGEILSERVPARPLVGGSPDPLDVAAWRERAVEAIEAALGPGPHPRPVPEPPPPERVPPEPMSDEARRTLLFAVWFVLTCLLLLWRYG